MTNESNAILHQALALHQQGHLQQAEILYKQVLKIQPRQFDAFHLLGVLARQRGDAAAAIDLIAQALAIDPNQATAHSNLGAALQDMNRPQEALASYDRALQIKPDYALALNNRGNALRKLKRYDEALLSYERALQINPDDADALCNRGAALQKLQRFDDALTSYERALRIKPDHAGAWCNRGIALQNLQCYEEALASYDCALRIKPDYADAFCNRGTVLQKLQRHEEALTSYDRALQLKQDHADAHHYRGNTLRALQRPEQAIAAYRQAVACGGDPESIDFALASLGAVDAPAVAPAQYIKNLFDQYAGHFDRHLVENLQYQTPDLLVAAITEFSHSAQFDCIDLGCGTGLCGPLLRPVCRTLTGIDLSPNMLQKARQRAVYDHLACGELTEFLSRQSARYDLAVAADVFVYIGDLAAVFGAVRGALRAGGIFGFTVEECDGQDFVLQPSARYAHSAAYLQKLAIKCGFVVEKIERRVIRQDAGTDINGYLVLMTCMK